jgi:non-homologous end joining protein Ku
VAQPRKAPVIDLMEALKKSLAAKKASKSAPMKKMAKRRKAAA